MSSRRLADWLTLTGQAPRLARLLPGVVFVLIGVGAVVVAILLFLADDARHEAHFSRTVADRAALLEIQAGPIFRPVLHVATVFRFAGGAVGPEEFNGLVQELRDFYHPSLVTLQWIPREIDDQGRERFPVRYSVGPVEVGVDLGTDLALDPRQRDLLDAAAREERLIVSGWYLRDSEVRLRVYRSVVVDRGEGSQLVGFISGVYRVEQLVAAILTPLGPGVELFVSDSAGPFTGQLLVSGAEVVWLDRLLEFDCTQRHAMREVDLFGSQWQLRGRAAPGDYQASRWPPLAIATGGLTSATFLAIYISGLMRREQQVRDLVQQRTEALARANEQLEALTVHDPLTGVANRRFLNQLVEREWRRERRHGHPVALLMVDVDFFKAYNDHFGHDRGDDCLRQVAQAMAQQLRRPADTLVRYGGEEFAVLLPETGATAARDLGEALRAAVAGLELPHPASSIAPVLTISIGVAIADPRQSDFETLLRRADSALYQAKRDGRNRVAFSAA